MVVLVLLERTVLRVHHEIDCFKDIGAEQGSDYFDWFFSNTGAVDQNDTHGPFTQMETTIRRLSFLPVFPSTTTGNQRPCLFKRETSLLL